MSKAARKKRQRALRDGEIVRPEPKYVVAVLHDPGPPAIKLLSVTMTTGPIVARMIPVEPAPPPIDPRELQRQELRDELRRLFEKRRQQGYRTRIKRPLAPMMPRISYLTQQLRELRP